MPEGKETSSKQYHQTNPGIVRGNAKRPKEGCKRFLE